MNRFDPETVDLVKLAEHLRATVGEAVVGAIVGRTKLRDEVAHHLECSMLDGEKIVDTLIGRGFVVWDGGPEGPNYWTIRKPSG